jgi:hypothetical protein
MRLLIRDVRKAFASAVCDMVGLVHVTEVGVGVDAVFREAC